ncbi:hypothetical protein HOD61_01665 [archaeon]|jgi:Txe/YoeB family toxin of Txe-Axe toxin-antitoxin module|nr:hypothetical protein [archaeon]
MINKYFSGISNSKNIFWVRLMPHIEVVKKINRIINSIDTDFGEGLLSPSESVEELKNYADFFPRRQDHQHKNNICAISIFNEDLIDLIFIKDSPIYKKAIASYKKEFGII